MKKKRVIAILFSLLFIWIDQLTKCFFYNLEIWSKVTFLEPLLNSWISRWMSMPMIIIFFVSIICILIFVVLFYKKYLTEIEFSLLFAWTIWNLSRPWACLRTTSDWSPMQVWTESVVPSDGWRRRWRLRADKAECCYTMRVTASPTRPTRTLTCCRSTAWEAT